ncbi:MAG: NAD-dependent epimerase/dehydratase family protein [Polyangiaceae bacterium]
MRVLLTGIAGFIGSHLAERMVARGDDVVGIDNFDGFYDRRVKERNLAALRGKVELREGDILDAELMGQVFAGGRFDVVVHLAALAGVRPSLKSPARYQKVNVEGTTILADLAIRAGVPRMVFASSSSVYGDSTPVPFREDDRADVPVSPYGASKRAGELVLRAMHGVHGLAVSSLRFFTVYGPRQRPEMAVHAFTRAIERGETITLFGSGTSRDYTYIDDIVAGTLAAVDKRDETFGIYNLGNSHAVALPELVGAIARALGREAKTVAGPQQPGDVQQTFASLERAERDLGYRPTVRIEDGVARFVEWYRAQPQDG